MPTLEVRDAYEICPICFWEDDGQDTDDADDIRGGPNADYSLDEARSNFKVNHTMYRASDENAFKRELKEMPMKRKMYQAFSRAVESGSEKDWNDALLLLDEHYRRD